jgi:DNA-3-methyladenine glycosylase II
MIVEMEHKSPPASLDQQSLMECVSYLCGIDQDLNAIVRRIGHPPLWSREPGFPTLLHIILEQQVSLASARAAFMKLLDAAGDLTPKRFIRFSDEELREFGFSRQKAYYGRELSRAILVGSLELEDLIHLEDNIARDRLLAIKGIGPWTADIYLLMALLRLDIWPSGDLALVKSIQRIKHYPNKPGLEQMNDIAEGWKPCRAVAARILWHDYLNQPVE